MHTKICGFTVLYFEIIDFRTGYIEQDITLIKILHANSVRLLIRQNGIQHKFAYNVKLIDFMRSLSVAANSVNEIYFMNAYNNKLLN